jgi:hypothetical protein
MWTNQVLDTRHTLSTPRTSRYTMIYRNPSLSRVKTTSPHPLTPHSMYCAARTCRVERSRGISTFSKRLSGGFLGFRNTTGRLRGPQEVMGRCTACAKPLYFIGLLPHNRTAQHTHPSVHPPNNFRTCTIPILHMPCAAITRSAVTGKRM